MNQHVCLNNMLLNFQYLNTSFKKGKILRKFKRLCYFTQIVIDGEVRRCASTKDCEEKLPEPVERECCNTDLCN